MGASIVYLCGFSGLSWTTLNLHMVRREESHSITQPAPLLVVCIRLILYTVKYTVKC